MAAGAGVLCRMQGPGPLALENDLVVVKNYLDF